MSVKFLNSNTALGARVAVGVSALVGPTGPFGPTGPSNPGVQGLQGLIGNQGYQGSLGPTGPSNPGVQGLQGLIGNQGPQGQEGSNGISGGLTLFLDTVGGTYSGSPISGSLLTFPNQTTGTIISSGIQSNTTINIARFISATGSLPTNIILGGLWDMNLFATCGTATSDSHYWFSVAYVDSDGVSNRVNIATGSFTESTQILDMISPYNNTIYVPTTTLPDTTKRILIDVYVQSIGSNVTTTLYTRDNTLSHIHTTLLATQTATGPQGAIGPQGPVGLGSSLPTGTYYGDYLYWTPSTTSYSVGSQNVVVGQNAGATAQQINAVAIGLSAGTSLQGTGSIAIGRQTGQTSQGEYSVGIGYNAAGSNQKSKSISIGYVSGQTNQQSNSIAIGTSSGNTNQMDYSVGIGYNAGSYGQNSYSVGLGSNAGQSNQGTGCVAIGYKAGNSGQLQTSIAIGDSAGFNAQGITAVAIGTTAGFTSQGNNAIAIGRNVGYSSQGLNSIAIGNNAGVSNQASYSIIINTTGTLNANTGGFYVNPIRRDISSFNLFYNTSTKEITYSTGGAGTQGVQGLIGPTGSEGPAGAIGATGPSNPGVQGLMGVTGAFGLQGVQGIAGAAVGSLANVKLSYTRTTDSPAFSNAGNRLFAFSGATGGINNTPASNITFTPSNGRFTVSEQGDYYFDARLIIKGQNNPDFITTDVYVNTGTVYNYTHVAYGIVSPVAFPIGLYLPLNAGDYVNIACYSTGTAGPINIKAGTTMNMYRLTNGPTGSFGATGAIGPTGPAGSGGGGSSQWISSTGGIIYYSSGSIGINKANPTVPLDVVGTVSITGPLNLTGNTNMIGNKNMTGTLNIAGNIVYTTTGSLVNPTFQNYQETVNIGTSSTSSYVINCNTGNNFNVTLATATTAFTFINVPATGTLENINLFLTQDNSGNRLATWPASVSWGNPSTPVLSTTGNATDIIALTTFSGGSKWFAFLAGKGF